MAHYEATFSCAFPYIIRLCHCWQTFRRLVTFCITANFISDIAAMANWNILSEALSVLEGRCDNKVTGTAYPCCSCLRTLVPVLHYPHQTRYTSDFCISVCHLSLGNKFLVLRLQVLKVYFYVALPRVHLRLLSGAN
jgi:hypothetical protein